LECQDLIQWNQRRVLCATVPNRAIAPIPPCGAPLFLPDKALQGMADSGKIRLAGDRLQLPDFAA
jgi:hypothetical protein